MEFEDYFKYFDSSLRLAMFPRGRFVSNV